MERMEAVFFALDYLKARPRFKLMRKNAKHSIDSILNRRMRFNCYKDNRRYRLFLNILNPKTREQKITRILADEKISALLRRIKNGLI